MLDCLTFLLEVMHLKKKKIDQPGEAFAPG